MADTPEIVKPLFVETPPPPTAVDIEIIKLDSDRRNLYIFGKTAHDKSYNNFWNNPNATPQELCERAKNPLLFFLISQKMQELLCLLNPYIDEQNPGYVPVGVPEGCDVTYRADGVDIIDNRPAPTPVPPKQDPVPPKPLTTEPAPQIPWKEGSEGVNPNFQPPTPPSE